MMCGGYFEKLQQLTKEEIEKMTEELTTFTITTSGGTGDCNSNTAYWTLPPAGNNGMQFIFVDDVDGDILSMDELGKIADMRYKFAGLSENFFDNYFEQEYEDYNWYEDEAFNLGCFARSARNYKDKRIGALMND